MIGCSISPTFALTADLAERSGNATIHNAVATRASLMHAMTSVARLGRDLASKGDHDDA